MGPHHFDTTGKLPKSAMAIRLLLALASPALAAAFVNQPPSSAHPAVPTQAFLQQHASSASDFAEQQAEEQSSTSWVSSLLGFGAALGLMAGLLAPAPARAITAEQFSQLTYDQVVGSGLANRCPTVDQQGSSVAVGDKSKLINMCFEPKSFAVEADTERGKEFVTTRLTTRQTYTIEGVQGPLKKDKGGLKFTEITGMDFQAVTVELPDGERVPFLFTVKQLVAQGEGTSFKPGYTWGGEFSVPSYRTGGFLDPKGRGMYTGYDQANGLQALQADGKEGQDELFKETNKVFDTGRGALEMEVNKVNQDLGEIGGVFVSKQPGDTDMGAKVPKTILLKGIFYGKVVNE